MGNFNLDTDEEKEWYSIKSDRSSEHLGDCLELMPLIADKSIDMILCDLPYGTTACKCDSILPLDKLWKEYKRVIKNNGVIVLTSSQPYTSILTCSNMEWFKYEWIWQKNQGSNYATVRYQPFKEHESVLIFYKRKNTYNPIKEERSQEGKKRVKTPVKSNSNAKDGVYGKINEGTHKMMDQLRYPSSVQFFKRQVGLHPTQKPVELMEYLIKTYTNEGETVLDNCSGSATTAIACLETNRKYIIIEKEKEYYNKGLKRIIEWKLDKKCKLF